MDMKRGEAAVLEWKTRGFSDVKAAEDVLQASRFFITRLQLSQYFACGAVRSQSSNVENAPGGRGFFWVFSSKSDQKIGKTWYSEEALEKNMVFKNMVFPNLLFTLCR